ncbi:MAG: aldo/keto reductase [Acidobacteria bacterium]|nr:aldo/keto reductase [Acidobacteriota bacterium]
MSLSRRDFVAGFAAVPALAAGEKLPHRVLGKTGARVSIVAFGGGSRYLAYKEEDNALAALNKALDMGITYVDTAQAYGNGVSETRVGKIMKTRRKEVFLATKTQARTADDCVRRLEESLKRLNTDQVDLLHIHALGAMDDADKVSAKGGVFEGLVKAKEQKMCRFIGVTAHQDPMALKAVLERHDFDCTQMALNAARVGMQNGQGGMVPNPMAQSFEALALPVANRKKMGIIAMKIFGQDHLVGKAPVDTLIRYSLSLPVSAAVLGMPKLEFIDENLSVARQFKPLPGPEMRKIAGEMVMYKAMLDEFFANHVDA